MKLLSRIFLLCFAFLSLSALAEKHTDTIGTTIKDSVITTKIKSQLAANSTTSATSISVETHHGVVTLNGTTSSDTEANTAVQIAESTEGVKNVNTNNLFVKDSKQPMQDSYITAKVKGIYLREKLFNNTDMPITNIKVETQNGVVYLSGHVQSDAIAQRASELAKSINGVTQVISNLETT